MTHLVGIRAAVVIGKIAARHWLLRWATCQRHPAGHDLQRLAQGAKLLLFIGASRAEPTRNPGQPGYSKGARNTPGHLPNQGQTGLLVPRGPQRSDPLTSLNTEGEPLSKLGVSCHQQGEPPAMPS